MLRQLAGGAALALTSVAAAQPVTITVDTSERVAVSPYLYGQFIEHLGRCIRGGIWAEMLRDRKFLLEPGKTWDVVKPAGTDCDVAHDTAGAYAGDHAMAVWVRGRPAGPCGVRQGGIGVVQGREYVGHVQLASAGSPTPVTVRLQWGPGPNDGQAVTFDGLTGAYARKPFRFTSGATTDDATLSITVQDTGSVWVGCASLMPADNVQGMRPDTLALIRRLNPPIMRWPGGNFVSGYQWKDAIGERDRRPPRWERAWNDVEDNDFGIDEFMAFCRLVKTEPYIAVNAGLGSAADAADEVEYANGSARTKWGGVRARNGRREPYGVVWWGVGNEMYGDWQLGHVPVERYALRHNAFVEAMSARDASICIIAVGAPGKWNDTLWSVSRGNVHLLSGHHYAGRGVRLPMSDAEARAYAAGFEQYSGSVAAGIDALVDDQRRRVRDAVPIMPTLAIDEWGIVRDWNAAPDEPGIGAFEHYYTLGDAVATARGLHALLRGADIVRMANWAQTVNVIGAIKTSRTAAVMDPAGLVLELYRRRMQGDAVRATVGTGTVDAAACLDRDGGVTVALVNYSADREATVRLEGLPRGKWKGTWRIHGPSLVSTNAPGRPDDVTTVALRNVPGQDGGLTLPPHSVTLVRRAP